MKNYKYKYKKYKLLKNTLFLNKMLFKFGIVSRSLCSFRNSEEETPFHIFHDYSHTKSLESTSDIH